MKTEHSHLGEYRKATLYSQDSLDNPTGFLTGAAANHATASGAALYLANGPVAFSQIETLSAGTDEILHELAPVEGCNKDFTLFTVPRPPFAGIELDAPILMGVVNVTPDSFSDGGDFSDPGRAIDQVLKLAGAGASIVDIGGESTRPGADSLTISEEISRVIPVIEAAVAAGVRVSVDTRRAEVMKTAIFAGAGVVNDITALTSDPGALEVVAGSESSVILMHMQGTPQNMQNAPNYRLASFDVCHWLNARVQACVDAGIVRGRIAIDPGIGFGKTDLHNTEILSRAAVLHGTGCAVALGVSRKSFIGRIGGIDDPRRRLSGTIGATLAALDRGVQIHRVHDVEEVQQAISIWSAIHDNA